MSKTVQNVDQDNTLSLGQALDRKTKYLNQLGVALKKHDDGLVYKLLDLSRYYHVIKQKRYKNNGDNQALVADLRSQLSHYLSHQLIKYLKRDYPFFYYYESRLGHFKIYFGDWWGHKLFGQLDVLHVKFRFDSTEYRKLKQTFAAGDQPSGINASVIKQLKRSNADLQKLVDAQTKRETKEADLKSDLKANESQAHLPWNTGRIKSNYEAITKQLKRLDQQDAQAADAKNRVRLNQRRVLALSKEDTVLSYEKRSVKKYFGNLAQFDQNNRQLYYNYISYLMKKSGGNER